MRAVLSCGLPFSVAPPLLLLLLLYILNVCELFFSRLYLSLDVYTMLRYSFFAFIVFSSLYRVPAERELTLFRHATRDWELLAVCHAAVLPLLQPAVDSCGICTHVRVIRRCCYCYCMCVSRMSTSVSVCRWTAAAAAD